MNNEFFGKEEEKNVQMVDPTILGEMGAQNQQQPPASGQVIENVNPSLGDSLDPELIKWQLSNDPLLEYLHNHLLGLEWVGDAETGKLKQTSNPLMNKTGLKALLTFLKPITDKGLILSILDEKEINMIQRTVMLKAANQLKRHYKEYGINKSQLDTVCLIIEVATYSALKRAFLGSASKAIAKSTERREILTYNKEKQNWFGFKR